MFLPIVPGIEEAGLGRIDEHAHERQMARRLFDKAHRLALRKRMTAAFHGRNRRLLKLTETQPHGGHYDGIHLVNLDQIVGSEGRDQDFDTEFLPVREHVENRWINVAVAFLSGKPMPPVELLRKDNTYYVRDGHHRISVARAMRFNAIEAEVVSVN